MPTSPSFLSIVGSVLHLPRQQCACRLRALLRHQVAHRAPARRPRWYRTTAPAGCRARSSPLAMLLGGMLGERRDEDAAVDDLATHRGPPVLPKMCTAPGRVLVSSPRNCSSHGWKTLVRVEHNSIASPCRTPSLTYSPCRSSSPMYSPCRSSSPTYSPTTPPDTPTPAGGRGRHATPVEPLGFELWGAVAAHRGAPRLTISTATSGAAAHFVFPDLAPPPLPPAPARPNVTVAANRHPGLRRAIPTGHVPAGAPPRSAEPRTSRSGQGEA
ncbi:hypothetical protein C2845_PM06G27530 [Panicum miliaceum]|uniref:Uncharacterized protein n=1 Tax=Panicum miliaceum TaxID=4540 RepID=A0A3L6R8L0_PANMI|nr:hypothetical protein C2845_PM06G27530 [Panicum miliaceum]